MKYRAQLTELSDALLRRYKRKAEVRQKQHQDAADFHGRRSNDHMFMSISGPGEYAGRHQRASDAHFSEYLKQRKKVEKRARGLKNAKFSLAKQLKARLQKKNRLGVRRTRAEKGAGTRAGALLNNNFELRDLMLYRLLEGEVKRRNKAKSRRFWTAQGVLNSLRKPAGYMQPDGNPEVEGKNKFNRFNTNNYNRGAARRDARREAEHKDSTRPFQKGLAKEFPMLRRVKLAMDRKNRTPSKIPQPRPTLQRLNNSFEPRELMFRQLLEGEVKRRNKAKKRDWEYSTERIHPDFQDPQVQSKKEWKDYQERHYDHHAERERTGRGDQPWQYRDTGDSLKRNKDRFRKDRHDSWRHIWPKDYENAKKHTKEKARKGVEASRQSPRPVLPGSPDYKQRAKESMKKRLETLRHADGYRPRKYTSERFRKNLNNSFDLMTNHMQTLFAEHGDLSEDFMKNAATLFETAVNHKVEQLREAIEADAAETAAAFIEDYCTDLVNDVDRYLTYVSEQVLEQQAAAADALAEEVTAEASDADAVVATMAEEINTLQEHAAVASTEVAELQEQLEAMQQEIQTLHLALEAAHKKNIVLEAAFDLTLADTEKLMALVEDVEFENAAAFTEKVHIVKHNVFTVAPTESAPFSDAMDEAHPLTEEVSPTIEAYAKMLSR